MAFIWDFCRTMIAVPCGHRVTRPYKQLEATCARGRRGREVLWLGRQCHILPVRCGLCEPCGGLSGGTLMAFKELRASTGWVIFILWRFGERPKATCWRPTFSETGYWVSNGCQGTSRMT